MALAAGLPVFTIAGCGGAHPATVRHVNAAEIPIPPKPAAPDRVIFTSFRPANWDIYLFEPGNRTPRRLTDDPALDYDATVSPDGRWVVFTSERRGSPDLYALDLVAGGEPKLLIDSESMEDAATLSPDGKTLVFVSDVSGNADIHALPFRPDVTQNIAAARNLTRSSGGDFRPAFSPDGTKIAFTSDRDNALVRGSLFRFTHARDGDIYVMNADGGNLRRLTRSPGWDGSPTWSRDGKSIFFYSVRGHEPSKLFVTQKGGLRIWAMDADGGNPRQLSPDPTEALSPAVTRDGRIVFASRTGIAAKTQSRLVSVGMDGTGLRDESDTAQSYMGPFVHAPTGKIVCHGSGTGERSELAWNSLGPGPLFGGPPLDVHLPDRSLALQAVRFSHAVPWHPRRNEVLLQQTKPDGVHVLVQSRDERIAPRELLHLPGGDFDHAVLDLRWSKDADWILYKVGAFNAGAAKKTEFWKARGDGSSPTLLVSSTVNEGMGDFSPDGRQIVFRSSRSGTFDLYLMNADGGDVRRLTDDPADDNFPVFAPGGNEIAFASDRDGETITGGNGARTFDIYTLGLGPNGAPATRRRITDYPGIDAHPYYSPDGKWLIFTSERGGLNDEEPLVQELIFAPQMYGELYAYRMSDGFTVRLTHNKWEDGTAEWLPPVSPAP